MRALALTLVLALALAVAAPAAFAQAVPAIERELEGRPIREIRFQGEKLTSEAYLREQIRLKVGDPYSRAALDADVKRLYETGRVTSSIEAYPEAMPGGVRIVFKVHELARVVDVEYRGLESYNERELAERGMRIHKPIERDGFHQYTTYQEYRAELDARAIVEMLREKGKFFAEVEHEAVPVPDGVKVVFHVREGPTVRVDDIVFKGNASIEGDELRKYMKTQPTFLYIVRSGFFERAALEEDVERIAAHYRDRGYLDARAFVEDLRFNPERDRVTVVIRVIEGERYTVRNIEIKGTTLYMPERIEKELELREGKPFSGRAIDADMNAIQKLYMDRGYILTRVRFSWVLVPDRPAIDLTFTVEEGVEVTIEKIRFEGNVKTRDDVIRRDLSLFPGEPFSAEQMDESKGRLGRRGYYKDLRVSFEPGTTNHTRDLVIRVEEAQTGQIMVGGGISTSTGFFGRFVFIQRNFDIADVPTSWEDIANGNFFVGGGQTLVVQLEPGAQRSRYRLSFVEPYFLPELIPFPLQFKVSLSYYDSVIARTYEEERLEAAAGLGYRLSRDSIVELTYRITHTSIFDISFDAPADVIEVAGDSVVSAVALAYSIDKNRIDQNFTAYAGWGANIELEVAGGPFGGDFDFMRIEANANWQTTLFYWPGFSKHVLGFRANAGWVNEYGRSDFVPIFERFYAGGTRSVRGFEFRSVGPQADDEPIGGEVRAVGGVEYGFPIIPGFDETYAPQWRGDFLRGVIFCDVGNVEETIDDFTIDDFRVGVGAGLRVRIPIFPAPVALDFGFAVREKDFDDPEIFSISIGGGF